MILSKNPFNNVKICNQLSNINTWGLCDRFQTNEIHIIGGHWRDFKEMSF
jgi:hypothetical protein